MLMKVNIIIRTKEIFSRAPLTYALCQCYGSIISTFCKVKAALPKHTHSPAIDSAQSCSARLEDYMCN